MKKLLALVIAGVAIKYFLDSEQGKQLQNQLKDWLGDVQDTFNETVNTATGKAKATVDRMS
jgi:hypothetical protein